MEDENDTTVYWESQTPIPSFAKRQKDPEWERKQRQREYRVAARREKRNRKADEKKQRKLNATLLRRMTRNPEKYTKNADRNKLRGIESERRMIRSNAVRQAERLAAIYDPSGAMFNVGPVVTQDDGSVVAVEVLRLREQRAKEKLEINTESTELKLHGCSQLTFSIPATDCILSKDLNADRHKLVSAANAPGSYGEGLSKTQQKKLARMDAKPHRPQPILPNGIEVPAGEDNWIAMWDLPDEELYRRILRAKKRKANERRALRLTQKSGKIERRAARDEKRRVYRDLKETWKVIKAEERRLKTSLKQIELRELKSIAISLNAFERQRALDKCADLGFTFENTYGLDEIKPRLYGLKGKSVDLDNLEVGEGLEIRPKGEGNGLSKHSRRVDLSKGSKETIEYIAADAQLQNTDNTVPGDFSDTEGDLINLDVGGGPHYEEASYNHRLRRKIRRALDHTQLEKELKIHERAIEYCKSNSISIPPELQIGVKATQQPGRRILENGTLETAKQERVRARLDLAEYNAAAKILRKQAKEIALEAGLRVHAELTGRVSKTEKSDSTLSGYYGIGWIVPPPPNPDDTLKDTDLTIKKQAKLDKDSRSDRSEDDSKEDSMDFAFELHGRKF